MKLIELTRTCSDCPTQWDGRLDDGRVVYIRYRHERLSIKVGPVDGDYLNSGPNWITVFEAEAEEPLAGLTIEDVCTLSGMTLSPDAGPFVVRPPTH
jgi:hypothetical protein